MSEELKACPFCGGEAVLLKQDQYKIKYNNGLCRVYPITWWHRDKQDAIKAWNRRAND